MPFSTTGQWLYAFDLSSIRLCPYAPGHASILGWFEVKTPPTAALAPEIEVDICPRTILRRVTEYFLTHFPIYEGSTMMSLCTGTPKEIQVSSFLWASNPNSFSLKIQTQSKLSTIMHRSWVVYRIGFCIRDNRGPSA